MLPIALAAFAAGCAYRTPPVHVPEAIPAVAPQEIEVVEVTVVDRTEEPDLVATAELRREVTELLACAAQKRGSSGSPARVSVRIEIERSRDIYDTMQVDGMASMALIFAPLGLVMGTEALSVDISMEAGGRTFNGHGAGDRMGSIYAPARRRALAVALDQALADASAAR